MKYKFLDRLLVFVRGGTGGNGLPKFMGVGGRGGNVYACTKKDQTMLQLKRSNPSKRFLATSGDHSRRFSVQGSPGEDCEISVPPGVQIITKQGDVLGDCNVEGDRVLLARGGAGGDNSNGFLGQQGEKGHVFLMHKLIADVGLVGFPNAGKSTLLRAISAAKPKIAAYPFTTMEPKVGMIQYEDGRSISMTDLPGLIEGASKNIGLGHSFLRHIERTKLLVFVVDLCGFKLKVDDPLRSALETVAILNKEIELYKPELLDKPAILVANKLDLPGAEQHWQRLQKLLQRREGAVDHPECSDPDPVEDSELMSCLSEEIRPTRWVHFEHVIAISARHRGRVKEAVDRGQELDHLRQLLRVSLDRLHRESQQASGLSPDLDLFRQRLRNGAYIPLRGRIVEMHDGLHHRRRREAPVAT